AGGGGGVSLGERRELGAGQIRLDEGDVGDGGAGVLGVGAVDRATEPTHQGRHLRSDWELPTGARLDDPNALDAADIGDLGPIALPHVQFGAVQAERLNLNHPPAWLSLAWLPDRVLWSIDSVPSFKMPPPWLTPSAWLPDRVQWWIESVPSFRMPPPRRGLPSAFPLAMVSWSKLTVAPGSTTKT